MSDVIAYTVAKAAAAISVSERTIWRLVTSGDLPTFKLGARTLIRADALQRLVDRRSAA